MAATAIQEISKNAKVDYWQNDHPYEVVRIEP